MTRFRGRLTRPSFRAEDIQEGGRSRTAEWRTFSAKFKAEAVRLVADRRAVRVTLAEIGQELDVRPDQLRAWTRHARTAPRSRGTVPGESLDQEVRRLRRAVAVLRQEQAFAKQLAVYFAKESR